jgi:predicted glycoside hydrolase/deacetylase ChbG (UPF0249 family)
MSENTPASALLGYPPEARLLILNADDFGMCYAENEATIRAIKQGLTSSCTLMIPCPWALHGIHLLRENPSIPFGVHLTAVSEYAYYRWGPLTCPEKVPSLVDETGHFYSEDRIPEFLEQVNLAELETEFRAQIEAVLAAGLRPTHLDSHCNIHLRRENVFDMTVNLAREYGLALRVSGRPFIEKLRRQGYPTNDHNLLDSYDLDTQDKPARYHKLLRELPAGLSEWAMHPGIGSTELQAITPSWHVRQADFDFLMSQKARDLVKEEGIITLSYESLQELWKSGTK